MTTHHNKDLDGSAAGVESQFGRPTTQTEKIEKVAPRRPKVKRSDSEKKRRMEKKLLNYYQNMVQEVEEWGPDYDLDE